MLNKKGNSLKYLFVIFLLLFLSGLVSSEVISDEANGVLPTLLIRDAQGKLVIEQINDDSNYMASSYFYDPLGRLKLSRFIGSSYEYFYGDSSELHSSLKYTDILNGDSTYAYFDYNSLGNITHYQSDQGYEQYMTYSSEGVLENLKIGLYDFSFSYDAHGNIVSTCAESPATGNTCTPSSEVYDENGKLIKDMDFTYEYYPDGKIKKRTSEIGYDYLYYTHDGKPVEYVFIFTWANITEPIVHYSAEPGDSTTNLDSDSFKLLTSQREKQGNYKRISTDPEECTDMDSGMGGNSIYEQNYRIYNLVATPDECADSQNLIERECRWSWADFSSIPKDAITYCPNGCWNGACRNVESSSVCGNLIVEYGEQCDDGNNVAGDGCSVNCLVEEAFIELPPGPEKPEAIM